MSEPIVRVGMGVFVIKDGKFLMLRRQGAHGKGTWCPPGGHIEFGESFAQTARREVKEETNLNIKNIRFVGATNDHFKSENKHYITVYMMCEWASGKERNMEPHKCTDMRWCGLSDMPKPVFLPAAHLIKSPFWDKIKQQLH